MHEQLAAIVKKQARRVSLKWVLISVFVVAIACTYVVKHLHTRKLQTSIQPDVYDSADRQCAEEAKDWFREYGGAFGEFDRSTSALKYSSHYRRSTHQCFVLVQNQLSIWLEKMSLWDVGEQVQYGSFAEYRSSDEYREAGKKPLECHVAGKPCITADQFKALVKPYIED